MPTLPRELLFATQHQDYAFGLDASGLKVEPLSTGAEHYEEIVPPPPPIDQANRSVHESEVENQSNPEGNDRNRKMRKKPAVTEQKIIEMVAIFPFLDTSWCIVTKWTRHMGFCITYTSLLMKTWRVSLTYRVKSAHKVKLTDQQLLQWMVPILLVMLIYLGTWTISDTPFAEFIHDQNGLKFRQCSYNWWDHSLAIGEVFFLAWGIRVCYNVRNAESLYNEARLISYAIYNIAIVNITMAIIHLFIFPEAGPDIKYTLGFVRTQLSTTTTIALVFGPKISRVFKGQGDKWDQKAKVRSITASFSLNGVGLVPEESPDLYQENEELKEQIQKLAHQIEFMKTVHMQINNRHLKPKPGGYFTITSTSFQAPFSKSNMSSTQTQTSKTEETLSGSASKG
ncbi:probable G-protein coupled receptor CG31760, partial [Glossina fuscipes]|uniref:Probable G-protein coupled receptor CG31760 n=1 Tax=Glossina fuscipes TaxID=7396 RepID=A0A9C6E009_9MUSC